MKPRARLTPVQWELLEAMARKMEVISEAQITRWLDASTKTVERLLSEWEARDWIRRRTPVFRACPLLGPLWHYCRHRGCAPDYRALVRRIEARHREVAPRQQPVRMATPKLCALFATEIAPQPHPQHTSHDVGLSEAYLWLRQVHPKLAARWQGERTFVRGFGEVKEDAILHDAFGEPRLAIDFLGANYGVRRIERLHRELSQRNLSYLFF